MANTSDYMKRLNERIRPNKPDNPSTEYYDLARNQEYTTLLDKEVALENSKANALKYTNNQLANAGLNSTGYGSSIQSGIYNTYLNKANEAQNTYNSNIQNLNQQEHQELQNQANDRFQSVTTMLQGADSTDAMNKLLQNYGYGTVENGEFKWGDKPEGMSDDDWYQMQYYYGLQQRALDQTYSGIYDTNQGNHYIYYDKNNNQQYGSGRFNEQNQELVAYVSSGTIPNGSYIQMENEHGDSIYVRYSNGQVYYATPEEYEKASDDECYYLYEEKMSKGKKKKN